METTPIKTAVLGYSDKVCRLLGVLAEFGGFEIIACGASNLDIAGKYCEQYPQCKPYDDIRRMITQNDINLLIVSEPISGMIEYIRMAVKKKMNILKFSPPARDYSETHELNQLCKSEGVIFCLVDSWRYSSSFLALKDYLDAQKIEQPFLVEAVWTIPLQIEQEDVWKKDPQLAGGGVLLYDAYQAFDMIVSNFGIPEQVYTLTTGQAADKQQRSYMTEDTAVISMRFSDSLIANVVASRSFGPESKFLRVYGKDKNIQIKPNIFSIFDNQGKPLHQFEYCQEPTGLLKAAAGEFIKLMNNSPESRLSYIEDNLKVMAVINAAYLSAKTAMPESPERIINLAQPASLV